MTGHYILILIQDDETPMASPYSFGEFGEHLLAGIPLGAMILKGVIIVPHFSYIV